VIVSPDFNVKLRADDAFDFYRPAAANGQPCPYARGRCSDCRRPRRRFRRHVFGDGRDDAGLRTDQGGDMRFAGALRVAEDRAQDLVEGAGYDEGGTIDKGALIIAGRVAGSSVKMIPKPPKAVIKAARMVD